MSCYLVAQIDIHDHHEYQKYLDGHSEVFSKYKGTVLAVDETPDIVEGEWPFSRTVLISFPNKQEAKRWYQSAEYQELAKYRHRASDANIVLLKGR